jgi:arabinofuranosyltransferase
MVRAVTSPALRRTLVLAPLALAAVVLVWHAWQYAFVTDDAYISFVFSRNLAEHGELTFNLGDPVEGYTNFLWTVILALAIKLGADPGPTSLVLGAACAVGTLVVTWRLMRRVLPAGSPWAYAPALLLAC